MILWLVPIAFIGTWIWFGVVERDWIIGFLPATAIGLIALLVCFGVCGIIEMSSDIEYEIAETCEISALADNARYTHTVSGSVFLIQARTDSTLKYSYMYYEEGRGFAFNEVNAKSCYINYTDETPRLEIYKPYFTNEFTRWLLGEPAFTSWDYVFYLPYNAEIIDSYAIDFE